MAAARRSRAEPPSTGSTGSPDLAWRLPEPDRWRCRVSVMGEVRVVRDLDVTRELGPAGAAVCGPAASWCCRTICTRSIRRRSRTSRSCAPSSRARRCFRHRRGQPTHSETSMQDSELSGVGTVPAHAQLMQMFAGAWSRPRSTRRRSWDWPITSRTGRAVRASWRRTPAPTRRRCTGSCGRSPASPSSSKGRVSASH